ncbi:MAG: glycoside hydrolase family 43 protein [Verrucomicrobiota bacterium]
MLINPIISAPSADPWMIFHKGFYYFCESRDQTTIYVRKSKSIFDIGRDSGVKIWRPPAHGPNCKNVWAPELHFLNGKWYIYYAADDGKNANHRMWVLESETSDPQGNYRCRGQLDSGGWAIDGTLLESDDGALHMIWSGWPGKKDGQQNIYIAPMSDPYTISGSRVKIAEPEHNWERVEMPICEGPQILKRDGKVFIVYSASASWTEDYCLGMLVHTGKNLLSPHSWKKISGPVFAKNERIWGVGHCSFVKSPCQTEDWILYHAKSERKNGWLDRHVHAQRFTWREDGLPHFGTPLPHVSKSVSLSE